MYTLWTLLFISLVLCAILVAVVVLANIITMKAIVGGSASSQSVATATEPMSEKQVAVKACDCPCHYTTMMPGERCMDCIYELCDEGTAQ